MQSNEFSPQEVPFPVVSTNDSTHHSLRMNILAAWNTRRESEVNQTLVINEFLHCPLAIAEPILVDFEPWCMVSQVCSPPLTAEHTTFQSSNRSCQGIVHFGQIHHDWTVVAGGDRFIDIVGTFGIESVMPFRSQSVTGFDLSSMSESSEVAMTVKLTLITSWGRGVR